MTYFPAGRLLPGYHISKGNWIQIRARGGKLSCNSYYKYKRELFEELA